MEIRKASTIMDVLETRAGKFVTVFFGDGHLSGILTTVGENLIHLSEVKMHGDPYGDAAIIRIDRIIALATP